MESVVLEFSEDRISTIIGVVNRHLKEGKQVRSIDEIIIRDISGMSNQTYILSVKTAPHDKVVIRFFMSKASNFEIEGKIFR